MTKEELKIWISNNLIQKVNGRLKTAYLLKLENGEFEEVYKSLFNFTSFLGKEVKLGERIYCVLNDISEKQKLYFKDFKNGYIKTRLAKKPKVRVMKKPLGLTCNSKEELISILNKNSFTKYGIIATARIENEKDIVDKIKEYTVFLKENSSLLERVYCILNEIDGLEKVPKCKLESCLNRSKFHSFKRGYQDFCSLDCQKKNRLIKAQIAARKSFLEKSARLKIGKLVRKLKNSKVRNTFRRINNSCRTELNCLSNKQKGKQICENSLKLFSESHLGNYPSEETKNKMRIKRAEFIQENGIVPSFNKKAVKWFNFINKKFNLKGQHALNGGEVLVNGYFLDFYDEKNKIIIEWDEERAHYRLNKETEKTIRKRNNLLSYFNGEINYINIRQKTFDSFSFKGKIIFLEKLLENFNK